MKKCKSCNQRLWPFVRKWKYDKRFCWFCGYYQTNEYLATKYDADIETVHDFNYGWYKRRVIEK